MLLELKRYRALNYIVCAQAMEKQSLFSACIAKLYRNTYPIHSVSQTVMKHQYIQGKSLLAPCNKVFIVFVPPIIMAKVALPLRNVNNSLDAAHHGLNAMRDVKSRFIYLCFILLVFYQVISFHILYLFLDVRKSFWSALPQVCRIPL